MSKTIEPTIRIRTSFQGTDEEIIAGFDKQIVTFIPKGYSKNYVQLATIDVIRKENHELVEQIQTLE